ncbi:MAG: hypothetical protein DRP29_06770 [Thermodesulfobacteriota bacterium]|nr:MAG: hypothetical protein DRP29_06770 [Thermodesulfobacteriota bacterium]
MRYLEELIEFFKEIEREVKNQSDQKISFKNFSLFLTPEDNKEKNLDEEIESLKKQIEDRKFVIYGAGCSGAGFILEFCQKLNKFPLAVIDKRFEIEKKFYGIPAMNLEKFLSKFSKDLEELLIVITVGKKEYKKQIVNLLIKSGVKKENIISFVNNFWAIFIPWIKYFLEKKKSFYLENKEKILKTLQLFQDEISIKIFINLIKTYIKGELIPIPYNPLEEQYFPLDVPLNKGFNYFLHGGAFVGDTIRILSKKGKIKKLICFEPDLDNFNLLTEYLRREKENIAEEIIAFPCGLWKENTYLRLKGTGSAACISEDGEKIIQVVAIDEVLPNSQITYITMDIEGAELEALYGARRLIKTCKPDLAIAVYHKPEHLWEIALYLSTLIPKYKFYLRNYTGGVADTILYATT